MNLTDMVRGLNVMDDTRPFSATAFVLAVKLIDLFNRLQWTEMAAVDLERMRMMARCSSRQTAVRARDELIERGVITVVARGKKGTPSSYRMNDLGKYCTRSVPNPVPNPVPINIKDKTNTSSIGSSEAEEEALIRDAAAHRRVVDAAVDAGFPDNVKTLDRITALIADYSAEWVETAIERCVDQSNSSLQYLCAVLDNFKRHGSPEAAAEAHRRKKQPDNDDPLAEPPWGWNQ